MNKAGDGNMFMRGSGVPSCHSSSEWDSFSSGTAEDPRSPSAIRSAGMIPACRVDGEF